MICSSAPAAGVPSLAASKQKRSASGSTAARQRVHQDRRVPAVEERVGEIEAADSEVLHLHALRQRPLREPPGDLDAEPVVAEEDVADPRDQDALHGRDSSSSAWKKKRWPKMPRSLAGSSSTVSAKSRRPSRSCSTPAMVAIFPASATSNTSARACGRSRTRSPG